MRESYSIKAIFKKLALKNILYYSFILHRSVDNWERAPFMKSDKKMFLSLCERNFFTCCFELRSTCCEISLLIFCPLTTLRLQKRAKGNHV